MLTGAFVTLSVGEFVCASVWGVVTIVVCAGGVVVSSLVEKMVDVTGALVWAGGALLEIGAGLLLLEGVGGGGGAADDDTTTTGAADDTSAGAELAGAEGAGAALDAGESLAVDTGESLDSAAMLSSARRTAPLFAKWNKSASRFKAWATAIKDSATNSSCTRRWQYMMAEGDRQAVRKKGKQIRKRKKKKKKKKKRGGEARGPLGDG